MMPMPQPPAIGRRAAAKPYSDIGASTSTDDASPHKLISLLYTTLLDDIHTARGAIQRGDVGAKVQALRRAVRIVDEGLAGALNVDKGGELAQRLAELYDYLLRRLTLANATNDAAVLAECASLVTTLKEGWDGISAQVHGQQAANLPAGKGG